MSAYVPEYVYGHIPGTYGELGLVPWPAHLTPRVELTKKGEAYVAAQSAINDRTPTLAEGRPTTPDYVPIAADAAGVVFLAISNDRASITATIERLVNMLDDMDGDIDFEEDADDEDGADAEPEETDQNGDEMDFSRSEDDALSGDLRGLVFVTIPGGQGL